MFNYKIKKSRHLLWLNICQIPEVAFVNYHELNLNFQSVAVGVAGFSLF